MNNHVTSINVRVDADTKNRVAALARVQGITISELVRGWFFDCIELEEDVLDQELRALQEEEER